MPKMVTPIDIPDGPFGHRTAITRLRALFDDVRYSVIHAHGLRAGIDAAIAARGSGTKVVTTVHNLVRPEVAGAVKAIAYKPAERVVVRLSDKVFAVSRDIADELTARARHDGHMKVEVLHLGVARARQPSRPAREVKDELSVGTGRPLVVTASRLSKQKDLTTMLTAVKDLDVTLAILGEGPEEAALRGAAARLGVAERVHFLGFRSDVADFIAAADVFCLSSVWEGVPLAVMEAVQLGTPVVATDVGGTGELIEEGVSGRLVSPRDPSALRAALDDVLADPEARSRYVDAARATLVAEFSTETMLARLRDVYLELAR